MQPVVRATGLVFCLVVSLPAADSAVIIDSGSTNTPGYRIDVDRSGAAVYTATPRRGGQTSEAQMKPRNRQIPAPIFKRFFADLDAEKSLSNLSNQHCMKSASFGTTLIVEHHGQKTPDLSCGDHGNPRLKALIQSTGEIIKLFNTE